jgi:16S rRNA (adenine1518-N6/adenine1519-N6)-dimethyltransferase
MNGKKHFHESEQGKEHVMITDPFALAKLSTLREYLSRHGFSFKKQLGQNFLIDTSVLEKIVHASEVTDKDGVLEIGPGAGVVTRALSAYAKKVVAVEKDESLRPVLQDTLAECRNVVLRFADVLEIDIRELFSEVFHDCEKVCVVANLPYYVTTPILFHILESQVDVAQIVVMVQKEVADRMTAKPATKDYGVLSVAVQYRAEVSKVTSVSRGCFFPSPNVDSTVVKLAIWGKNKPVQVDDEGRFFKIVRSAFGMRRKTILNALSGGMAISKERCADWLRSADIDPKRRGETLSLHEFSNLSSLYSSSRD